MKESVWLREYEKEVKAKRDKSNGSKKIILIIIPLMMVLALVAAMVNGGSGAAVDTQGQEGMLPLVAVFVGIFLFVILMLCIGKKKDVAKHTRNNVTSLLRTEEEVNSFDQQMSAAPIKEIKIAAESSVFLTQDYVGIRYMYEGNLNYTFVHRSDIAYFDYAKTKSATANPLKAAYFFDVLNTNKKIIMNGRADSGAQLAELEELLKLAQPAIQRK